MIAESMPHSDDLLPGQVVRLLRPAHLGAGCPILINVVGVVVAVDEAQYAPYRVRFDLTRMKLPFSYSLRMLMQAAGVPATDIPHYHSHATLSFTREELQAVQR